ncbi:MAG TPA: hypothetical protein VFX91_00435 [Alcanivorax sp.]|nr:hypothetical protein [Alcanivorax sp.]
MENEKSLAIMRGNSVAADFEKNEWVFHMTGDYEVGAGEYVIAPTSEFEAWVTSTQPVNQHLLEALKGLLAYAESNECHHEETERLGVIWTSCRHCGEKWADDKGGFQPYQEPACFGAARDAIAQTEPAGAVKKVRMAVRDEAYTPCTFKRLQELFDPKVSDPQLGKPFPARVTGTLNDYHAQLAAGDVVEEKPKRERVVFMDVEANLVTEEELDAQAAGPSIATLVEEGHLPALKTTKDTLIAGMKMSNALFNIVQQGRIDTDTLGTLEELYLSWDGAVRDAMDRGETGPNSLPEMSRDELRSHIVELYGFIQRTLVLLPEVKAHLKRGYIAEDTWTLVNSVEALLDDIEQARGGGES